ncbi:MAG: NAD(P)-binding protein [Treponema sp.]|nr:NAD(P)-binding protein [Treponema sp.]
MIDVVVVGCGLSGMVVARELAEKQMKVHIIEKRNHIGGNIFDYYNSEGCLVQKYGPHVFFTNDEGIEQYVKKFVDIMPFFPEYRTKINGKYIPMPFNFASIDLLYTKEHAELLKGQLLNEFHNREIVSVLDLISSNVKEIHDYGMFMFEHEYRKYSSKHWNIPIDDIDPAVFTRVPVYLSYKREYEQHKYQFMPCGGFTKLAQEIINHENITYELNVDALTRLKLNLDEKKCLYVDTNNEEKAIPIVYTGPLDELFSYKNGFLPYRSLEFVWKTIDSSKAPETEITAYPEGDKYLRITDYTRFPKQECKGKSFISIEIPVEYKKDELFGNEPYYPVLTEQTKKISEQYYDDCKVFSNIFFCGRLAEFKYYNMDSIINNAKKLADSILQS